MVTVCTFILTVLLIFNFSLAEEDSNVIYLQVDFNNVIENPITLIAFGQNIELKLKRNNKLLSPSFKIYHHPRPDFIEEIKDIGEIPSCHYLHEDNLSIGALSFCNKGVQGLIVINDTVLEINPLYEEEVIIENLKFDNNIPHLVKRSYISRKLSNDQQLNSFLNHLKVKQLNDKDIYYENNLPNNLSRRQKKRNVDEIIIELAIFFDEPGYKIFSPFFKNNDEKIRDMLLAYINSIQALFYHRSLGIRINIALVRLDIMKHQPIDLPHYSGERLKLLNSFCNYTASINPHDDENPNHWDMGLYISGLDFYAYENGRKDGVTMGLATVSGVCLHQYSCVIAELGVTNHLGKPYPSAGFTSVYIAAHEIGHNLGMHHDSKGNSCTRDGFIMSPSRGTSGETIWSSCSREIAINLPKTKPCLLDKPQPRSDKSLNHEKFLTLPGREWTAKKQCELLLRDRDAQVVTLTNACQSLQCHSPHRSGYYFAGPALDGTICEEGKECRGGECLPALHFLKPNKRPPYNNQIGWSKWTESSCSSGCIKKSKGFKSRKRVCKSNLEDIKDCKGSYYNVILCQDDKLCKKRITAEEYATMKCQEFSEKIPELDKSGLGLQAPHEMERPWMGCAIFCKRVDIASYYTPRIELNDLGIDPYFPDGTWCHRENGEDYFCLQHHCLPSSFRFPKDGSLQRNFIDVELGPQNARPDGNLVADDLIKYFSLGMDGLPLNKNLPDVITPNEEKWEDTDYIELPDDLQ
ncbi:A disintegrin and metalloproteinase with thrombospondin motifs adt-2-like [Chelonus insularis]|uniref:A disintegrin and metalloproteinase with thrombospondin motifs adt-2-like n=1 Tax=Chelonus insularis TaxID=460826 RepID=UPI00158E2C73|nr:A disintegrin and metalloproteinase with thrombospondin motifs adt-2-like [Chelonus insularis]